MADELEIQCHFQLLDVILTGHIKDFKELCLDKHPTRLDFQLSGLGREGPFLPYFVMPKVRLPKYKVTIDKIGEFVSLLK